MELAYPKIIYYGIPALIVLVLLYIKRPQKYKEGKRVTGVSVLESSKAYKRQVLLFKVYRFLMMVSLIASIVLSMIIAARPHRVKTVVHKTVNRDIILCFDVSDSMDDVNIAMCQEFRRMIDEFEGERIGVTIFNSRSVTLVPLTTDYEYVKSIVDKLEVSFKSSDFYHYYDDSNADYVEKNYKYYGTITFDGNSSLIGDGLASALFSFPDIEEDKDRARVIIFVTDNELAGEPHVTVTKAAEMCKDNDVKVFALSPYYVGDEAEFKRAMKGTGGGLYQAKIGLLGGNRTSKAVSKLVEDVQKTRTSEIEDVRTYEIDLADKFIVALIALMGLYYLLGRRIRA